MERRDELAQPSELAAGEGFHVGEALAKADHGAQGGEQHIGQRVEHTPGGAFIREAREEFLSRSTSANPAVVSALWDRVVVVGGGSSRTLINDCGNLYNIIFTTKSS